MRAPAVGSLRRVLKAARDRLGRHGTILLYHRIGRATRDPWSLCVAPERFAEHLDVLGSCATVVPLRSLLDAIPSTDRNRPPVAITFDDGYADNLHQAKPLLERYGMPATVFVATGYLGARREFWSDRLERIVLAPETLPGRFSLTIAGTAFQWNATDERGGEARRGGAAQAAERRELLFTLWRRLRPLPAAEQERLLDAIERWAGGCSTPDPERFPLSHDELRRLAGDGLIEIGAHTVTHCELPSVPPDEQKREIARSKAECEAVIGKPVTSFAYPYGRYDEASAACVRDSGFSLACSTMPRLSRAGADRFRLPRFAAQNWDGDEFERRFRYRFTPILRREGDAA